MWDLIVSVPDHCLSFYFVRIHFIIGCKQYILYLYILYSDFGLRMIRVWTKLFCSTW